MGVSGQPQVSVALSSGKSSDTHQIGELVGPRASVDVFEKRKVFALAGIRSPDRPTNTESLMFYYKFHYRPGQTLRAPEVRGCQISRQLAHESGKVVSPTHRSPLPKRKYSWYSFLLEAKSTPGP